ncbi:GH1 family beta-glucosidase [Turneriella parva]|uniref:Beta-glucosidase n=1 Tax=Turneriella parva (strain ATCC BAA-1111 / DSM 21527 / NCTC 11395 / H) TaxID=869212 RepID=I4B8U7_TURPD|nr:GH1 family beta-glucosidase [Turneriella parva]AFM13704.1 beta-galactosidase [Turneriella parva DSM 21527]
MSTAELKRADFGDFVFGAATSAYQIEGAHDADGKTDSIWDTFTRRRRKIKNREHGRVACDHYHRVDGDVAIMQKLNLQAYRFSISWPRLQPTIGGAENIRGTDFYSRLVDKLLRANIRPFITLYHWDMPQYLEDKGGWINRDTIGRFADFASLVGRRLGDRVKDFIVFNEPMIFLSLGNLLGLHAPGRRSLRGFFAASHHVLLAQAEGARALRAVVGSAEIGTTISATAAYPASTSPRDVLAAQRFDTLFNTFYLEPVLGRGYPTAHFPALRRIEKHIRAGDMQKLQFDFDFWGLNTYTRKRVKYSRFIPFVHWRELKNDPNVPETAMRWEIYPQGIYDLLKKYGSYPEIKKLYVTENGAAFHDQVVQGRVADSYRIEYLREYLRAVQRAKSEGVKIAGYFAWSLLDNFEWAEGYHARFGLTHVDYGTQKRTIKDSGYWYSRLIAAGSEPT